MTTIMLHRPPILRGVWRQQLRTVRRAMRRETIVLFAVLAGVFLLTLFEATRLAAASADHFGFQITPPMTWPTILFGLLAAGAVWQREEPSRRGYHLAMPVRQDVHTALRVAAGWVWLMVGVAGYVAMLLLLAALFAGIGGGRVTSVLAVWGWIAPFAAATMVYLFVSIPMVGSERPLVWVFATPFAVMLVLFLPGFYHWQSGAGLIGRWLASPFSPGAIVSPLFYVNRPHGPGPVPFMANLIDWQAGVVATVFWTSIGILGVWLAARWRRTVAR